MTRDRKKVIPLTGRWPAPDLSAPETIDEAIELHLDAMYGTARLLTGGDHAAAEDLVQESALSAVRAWGALRAPEAARAWLLRILYRSFLSTRRRRQRRPAIVDVDLEELLEHSGADDFGADDLPAVALSEEMTAALESLPVGYREVVWLVDVEALTLAETAEVLGIPVGTAASRVHRARARLRAHLRKQDGGS